MRMNPLVFLGSKMGEDPQEFIWCVQGVEFHGVTSKENVELDSYQLREVYQVWYTQWKDNRPIKSGPIEW